MLSSAQRVHNPLSLAAAGALCLLCLLTPCAWAGEAAAAAPALRAGEWAEWTVVIAPTLLDGFGIAPEGAEIEPSLARFRLRFTVLAAGPAGTRLRADFLYRNEISTREIEIAPGQGPRFSFEEPVAEVSRREDTILIAGKPVPCTRILLQPQSAAAGEEKKGGEAKGEKQAEGQVERWDAAAVRLGPLRLEMKGLSVHLEGYGEGTPPAFPYGAAKGEDR